MKKHSEHQKKEPKHTMKDFFQSQKASSLEKKQMQQFPNFNQIYRFPQKIDNAGDLSITNLAPPILYNSGSNKQPQLQISSPPTLGMLNEDNEFQTKEEAQSIISEYDFVGLIIKEQHIPCKCNTNKCNLCQSTKMINVQQMKNQLNDHFRDYFHRNYQALIQFLQDNYNITIENFSQWVEIHRQMQFPSENKKFIFQCSLCHQYLKDQSILFRSEDQNCCSICKNTVFNTQFQQFNYKEQSIFKAGTPLFGESQIQPDLGGKK